jgi:hypothetical protein
MRENPRTKAEVRHVGHHDAAPVRRLHVDQIVTSADPSQQPASRHRGEQCIVNARAKQEQAITVFPMRRDVAWLVATQSFDIDTRLPRLLVVTIR